MIFSPDAPVRGAIAAVTRDRVIGLDGGIPWRYAEDLKRFKRVTMGATVIMGRLTWQSIKCTPLPGRRNIVLSRRPVDRAEHFNSLEGALETCADEDAWIIGGGQIYKAAFDRLTLLDITYVPDEINDGRAVKFPVIDPKLWKEFKRTGFDNSALVNVVYHRVRFSNSCPLF